MLTWAIETEGVFKSFGQKPALEGIELKVRRGEFLTVFGPNGAGKTTLIKVLSTLSKPDSGRVILNGLDTRTHAADVRRSIGVVTHQTFLYDTLTAYENLHFYGRMFGVPDLALRAAQVISQVGLSSRANDRVRTFSRGMLQRLSIARAILHRPQVLLMDEPETGLDQTALLLLKEALQAPEAEQRTVVMTTHNLERGLALSDRAVILVRGRVVHDETRTGEGGLAPARFQATYHNLTGARE